MSSVAAGARYICTCRKQHISQALSGGGERWKSRSGRRDGFWAKINPFVGTRKNIEPFLSSGVRGAASKP